MPRKVLSPRARAEELARDRARRAKEEEASQRLITGGTKSFGARAPQDGRGRSRSSMHDEDHVPATRRTENDETSGASPTSVEDRAEALVHELERALTDDRARGDFSDTAASRVSVLIFRTYMEAMHQSMHSKDDRITRLLLQLEQSRAEAQIMRLEQGRSSNSSSTAFDVQQARLAASAREHLQAKDRMLQLYDEREEEMQRTMDQLHETIRMVMQRIDAILVVQGLSLSFSVRDELERVMHAASDTLPGEDAPDMPGRHKGNGPAVEQIRTANNSEIGCQRTTLDEMSREIELLLQQNEVLQERLDRKPLEVQDAIEQALANVDETNDREKNDLTRRVRELEGHADKVMMRQHSLTSRHDSELKIKDQDLAEALAQVKALKHEIVVLKRENTAICTEINRQAQAADDSIREIREDHHSQMMRKEERIKALLEDLDESRQAYLKVVSELSERVLLSEIVAEPDPIEEVIIEHSKQRQQVEELHQESVSTMRSVRKAHDEFAAKVRSRLRVVQDSPDPDRQPDSVRRSGFL